MENKFKPYKGKFPDYSSIPEKGIEQNEVLRILEKIESWESVGWKNGYASGAVYNGSDDHISFSNKAYSIASQSNPLHPDIWPSSLKLEREIVSMTSEMLTGNEETCGTVTSGGTESILLAMKTYRDLARDQRGITDPEIILPVSAHAAFDKACNYFGIRPKWVSLDGDFKADVESIKKEITKNTAAIVGSAPCFPYGVIDPIEEMSKIADDKGIPFHVDACLGGFVLPWAKKLGFKVPDFDFSLPGVTSISVDTHKYGYAPKGTSVLLYRSPEFLHYQYYATTRWPGGIYYSPTLAGSRSGGVIAAAWAVMLMIGKNGYKNLTRKILNTASEIKKNISAIPEVEMMGDSLWVITFNTRKYNVYQVSEEMSKRGWSLNGLHRPPGVHLAVTLRHTNREVPKRFVDDLKDSIEIVKSHPSELSGMAPIYGMAGTLPEDSMEEFLKSVIEWMYRK